ncbi:helix-turn-helix transcriptional regulator [Streptomyces sp. RLB3-5]|uniref:MmyB family transcriptional regulator n=1 Tax=unclassified Streptomyces TaxID=2593676 RepID=UPI0011651295|nr:MULTISPECIES: helix-turn-helix domain-containing protein [unclassified Streptomyces]QDO51664.1 helix-turn-helix transcriptional regulator [Streptomyces sp. RLB3-5]QDO61905.1 helix-turn-helix transcriptional regulator [Streptomyces sp. RLB1-8]
MPTNDSSQPAPQATITRILRQARRRIDPRDIPGAVAALGPRNRPGLTQNEVAQLLGVSSKWYRNLELGKPLSYSKALLEGVRRILALTEGEWETVWQLTHGRPASDAAQESAFVDARQVPPPPVRRFIEAQRWPAYLCDHRWDLLFYNRAASSDFPWMLYGTNVMVWTLTCPEARTQLIRWEQDWATPMIVQLRLHAERWNGDVGLQAIIRTVQADPVARGLWNSPDLPATSHPGVTGTRKLYLPRQGTKEFEVSLLTMKVDDMPSHRLTIAVPNHDGQSVSQLIPETTSRSR